MAKQSILKFEFDEVLDPKTRELCALAAAAAGGCSHWIRRHFADAKTHGASDAEIRQVLAMGMMVGAARVRNFVTDTLEIGLRPGA